MGNNIVRQVREDLLISKTELARKAALSIQTINRIEKGESCKPETKRKILFALGFDLTDRKRIFPDN